MTVYRKRRQSQRRLTQRGGDGSGGTSPSTGSFAQKMAKFGARAGPVGSRPVAAEPKNLAGGLTHLNRPGQYNSTPNVLPPVNIGPALPIQAVQPGSIAEEKYQQAAEKRAANAKAKASVAPKSFYNLSPAERKAAAAATKAGWAAAATAEQGPYVPAPAAQTTGEFYANPNPYGTGNLTRAETTNPALIQHWQNVGVPLYPTNRRTVRHQQEVKMNPWVHGGSRKRSRKSRSRRQRGGGPSVPNLPPAQLAWLRSQGMLPPEPAPEPTPEPVPEPELEPKRIVFPGDLRLRPAGPWNAAKSIEAKNAAAGITRMLPGRSLGNHGMNWARTLLAGKKLEI